MGQYASGLGVQCIERFAGSACIKHSVCFVSDGLGVSAPSPIWCVDVSNSGLVRLAHHSERSCPMRFR